ncbi:carbohydrate binding family 9 domain-containing protein [Thalassotalea piscium]
MVSHKTWIFTVILGAFLCAIPFTTSANTLRPTQSIIDIPHIEGAISIDAKPLEPQWRKAKKVLINNITRPFDNIPSTVHTEALLMEDGNTLYILFIAQDPEPEKIRAFYKDRDKVWGDDIVGIKIDTFNDQRSAYRFLVNPLGVKIDGKENEVTQKESDAWDGIWSAAGEVTCDGYIVEMAIPLSILNFTEKSSPQDWGIELMRFYPREESMRLSNIYLDRNNSCELCQLATATGFSGAKPGSNLTITPSLVLGKNQERSDDDNQWIDTQNIEPSLDFRWGITPDIILNTTINPDFSTIETDSSQLNINNTFALFFEEKRAFFLDNADYFDSNYDLIYTRNINAPNYGAKLTGRKDHHSFGLFVTDDDSTNILIPGNRSSSIAEIDSESKAAALRYRYNFNKNITLGWISTLRTADDYQNQVHGIDARVRLGTYDVIKFQNLYSDTDYPTTLFEQFCDADNPQDCLKATSTDCEFGNCNFNENVLRTLDSDGFSGNAVKAGYYHNDSDWYYRVTYDRQNAGFRGDLGFISRVDYNKFSVGGDHKWYGEPGAWWSQFKIYSDWDVIKNDNNELIEKEFDINAQLSASYNTSIMLAYSFRDKVGTRHDKTNLAIDGNTTLFTEKDISLYASVRPYLGFSISADISMGDAIDYTNNRLGESERFTSNLTWNLNQHIELKLKHTFSQLNADESSVFIARLTDLRAVYQFDVKSFLRFSVIYNNTNRNVANYLYIAPEDITANSKNLSTELLYAYKINSQTVFYLGYSDSHDAEQYFRDLQQNERSVFTKFSYAWVQ